jgi:hypothetical protein
MAVFRLNRRPNPADEQAGRRYRVAKSPRDGPLATGSVQPREWVEEPAL